MTSQPPLSAFAFPMSSPFSARQSAWPRTRQPVRLDPVNVASGLKSGGSAARRPRTVRATAIVTAIDDRYDLQERVIALPPCLPAITAAPSQKVQPHPRRGNIWLCEELTSGCRTGAGEARRAAARRLARPGYLA